MKETLKESGTFHEEGGDGKVFGCSDSLAAAQATAAMQLLHLVGHEIC